MPEFSIENDRILFKIDSVSSLRSLQSDKKHNNTYIIAKHLYLPIVRKLYKMQITTIKTVVHHV